MKMNMETSPVRRDGKDQTKTLGDNVEEGIAQILITRSIFKERNVDFGQFKEWGQIGVPMRYKIWVNHQNIQKQLREARKKGIRVNVVTEIVIE